MKRRKPCSFPFCLRCPRSVHDTGRVAYTGDVWSNSDSFTARCLGFTDTYPQQLYSLTTGQMGAFGLPAHHRRARVLIHQVRLPERGLLRLRRVRSQPRRQLLGFVRSAECRLGDHAGPRSDEVLGLLEGRHPVEHHQVDTIGTPYNLVIMSTCNLGSSSSTMPNAFQIEMTKASTQREFYLGYAYLTYDSSELRFERAFWSYLNGAPTTSDPVSGLHIRRRHRRLLGS